MEDQQHTGASEARRAAYDRFAQSLVGLRLTAIRYVVIGASEEPEEPDFDWDAEFDHLDWGLDLEGENGRVVGFGWESAFEDFNLGLYEGGLGMTGQPVLNASRSPRWKSLVGRAVTGVDVRWIEDEEKTITYRGEDTGGALLGLGLLGAGAITGTGRRAGLLARLRARIGRRMLARFSEAAETRGNVEFRQRLFPVAVQLTFGTDRIWIGAVEVHSEGESWVGADSITVASDADAARRIELWE